MMYDLPISCRNHKLFTYTLQSHRSYHTRVHFPIKLTIILIKPCGISFPLISHVNMQKKHMFRPHVLLSFYLKLISWFSVFSCWNCFCWRLIVARKILLFHKFNNAHFLYIFHYRSSINLEGPVTNWIRKFQNGTKGCSSNINNDITLLPKITVWFLSADSNWQHVPHWKLSNPFSIHTI